MKILGLIGYPLSHSFSQKYFTEKFEKENIKDYVYKNFPLESIDRLPDLIKQEKGLVGLNVTIPYKQQVMDYLNEPDETAKKIGAVNTISIFRESNLFLLKGYNTDSYGFEKPLLTVFDRNIHKKALILGTGGASKAVEYVLNKHGLDVKFVSRTPRKKNHLSYHDLNKEIIESHTVIVNTSPLGMYPDIGSFPEIPYQYLNRSHILYDLVYNPLKTVFLKKGEERGAVIITGLEMLHLQAEKAWEIWQKI